MSQVVEIQKKDGTEDLVDIEDTVDALTKKKMMQILDTTTEIRNGETTHKIQDSASKSIELMDLFCKRALRNSDVNAGDLTEDSKVKIANHLQEDLESMGMKIDKKKPGSSQSPAE